MVIKFIGFVLFFVLFIFPASAERVGSNLVVLYDFTATEGVVIKDRTDVLPSLDLTIPDPSKVEWLNPGLRVKETTLAKASNDRTKLSPANFFSVGITIEAWIKPLNITQGGPARIVTFSKDSGDRNFTLGQVGDSYDQRFRTSVNIGNGSSPSTRTPAGSTRAELQHVVYTRDSGGSARLYVDKLEGATESISGEGTNWDMSFGFGLFNETNYPVDTRTWLGDVFLVAIYDKALSSVEIAQNFDAGVPTGVKLPTVTLAWDANTEDDLAGYKIYYGKQSRYDPALLPTIPESIKKGCQLPDEGELTPTQQSCKESWENYCKCTKWEFIEGVSTGECEVAPDPADPLCDFDYFDYDTVIDVKNVLEYTITGLVKGETYFIAATAYDTDYPARNHESKFSKELVHVASFVSVVIDLRLIPSIP